MWVIPVALFLLGSLAILTLAWLRRSDGDENDYRERQIQAITKIATQTHAISHTMIRMLMATRVLVHAVERISKQNRIVLVVTIGPFRPKGE